MGALTSSAGLLLLPPCVCWRRGKPRCSEVRCWWRADSSVYIPPPECLSLLSQMDAWKLIPVRNNVYFHPFWSKTVAHEKNDSPLYCVRIIRVFMYEAKSRFSSLTPFIVTFLWDFAQRRNGKHSLIVLLRPPRHGRFCLAVTSWRDPILRSQLFFEVFSNQRFNLQTSIEYSYKVVKGKSYRS